MIIVAPDVGEVSLSWRNRWGKFMYCLEHLNGRKGSRRHHIETHFDTKVQATQLAAYYRAVSATVG